MRRPKKSATVKEAAKAAGEAIKKTAFLAWKHRDKIAEAATTIATVVTAFRGNSGKRRNR